MTDRAGFSKGIGPFAELGWLGLPFAEEDGGFGGSAIDTMIVMEAFGKGLVVEPYVSTVLMAGSALAHAGTTAQKAHLAAIIGGEAQATLVEPQARFNLNHVVTRPC